MPTHSQDEALRRMSKLVSSLLARNDCGPFREPVDWRGLELYDYPKIIKKMMDLGTVKRKLERRQYPTAHQCAEDIRLVWKNCLSYNADGSDFWLLAKSFSRRFEDRYRKIKSEFDVGEPDANDPSNNQLGTSDGGLSSSSAGGSGSQISLDEKAKLGSMLFRLSGLELAHVISMLENDAPTAIQTDKTAEVEIVLDELDPGTFARVATYVGEKVATGKRGMTDNTKDQPDSKPVPRKKKR